jgi:membrane associated rhomboid family serine protease
MSEKLKSELVAAALGLSVALAYLGSVAIIMLVLLQLASGYSSSFLGLWTPPNTSEFRRTVGVTLGATAVVSAILAVLGVRYGSRRVRLAAIVPMVFFAMLLLFVLFNQLT